MYPDFTEDTFDISTLRVLSASDSKIRVKRTGTPVIIGGERVFLFNIYDALEMALRDELLAISSDEDAVDLACDLIMDELSFVAENAGTVSDLENWLTAPDLILPCITENDLPWHFLDRMTCRLRLCLRKISDIFGSESLLHS